MPNKKCLLFGGGLDSVAYAVLDPTINCFAHYKYGQLSAGQEKKVMRHWGKLLGKPCHELTLSLSSVYNSLLGGDHSATPFVRGRNLNFIVHLFSNFPKITTIVLGLTDPGYAPFADADQEFIDLANQICKKSFSENHNVEAQFVNVPRADVIRQAYEKNSEVFAHSFTCWTPDEDYRECGACKHCVAKSKLYSEITYKGSQ